VKFIGQSQQSKKGLAKQEVSKGRLKGDAHKGNGMVSRRRNHSAQEPRVGPEEKRNREKNGVKNRSNANVPRVHRGFVAGDVRTNKNCQTNKKMKYSVSHTRASDKENVRGVRKK